MSRQIKRKPAELQSPQEVGDEIGMDDKDIPGGIPHQQNPVVPQHLPLDTGPRRDPFRGPMSGGVPHVSRPHMPKEDKYETSQNMATMPFEADPDSNYVSQMQARTSVQLPVPVMVINPSTGAESMSRISGYQIPVSSAVQLAPRSLHRSKVTVRNEDSVNGVRIAYSSVGASTGFLLPAGTSQRFTSQDEVWGAPATSGSAITVSVLCEYGVAGATGD